MNEVYWSDKRYEMDGSDWPAEDMARAIPYMLKERVEKFRSYGFNVKGLILDAGTGVGIDILALKELGCRKKKTR